MEEQGAPEEGPGATRGGPRGRPRGRGRGRGGRGGPSSQPPPASASMFESEDEDLEPPRASQVWIQM